jgi:aminoglycoside phosphotransferase
MKPDEIQKSVPPDLAEIVLDYGWRQIDLGLSPSEVFRLEAADKKSLYLKISPRGVPGFSLSQEKQRLDWLKNLLPVPEVLLFTEDEASDYLLLSEISGLPASDDSLKNDIPNVIEQLASGLKMIHAVSIDDCPFDERMDHKILLAEERVERGLVDEKDFDDERRGMTARDLFEELVLCKPPREELVFTHGDYCVPNVILKNGRLSGFVDWGNAGPADRYQDLALLTRSVCYNFGAEWEKSVFEIYGIEPDWKKIHFYRLLDEFF